MKLFCSHKSLSAPRRLYPVSNISAPPILYQSCRDCGADWEYDEGEFYEKPSTIMSIIWLASLIIVGVAIWAGISVILG